jgi:biotin transport system substrate-specific component
MPMQKPTAVARPLSLTNERLVARLFWITTFAVLTAASAQVEIPHSPVPFTAQTLIVLLSGALLGPWGGASSMVIYLLLGAAGLPVFSGLSFGPARLLGPTGGYLLAFPAASLLVGWMTSRKYGYWWTLFSMAAGLLVVFAMGTVQLWAVVFRDWSAAVQSGFLIFTWWDGVKLIAAAGIAHQYFKRTRAVS